MRTFKKFLALKSSAKPDAEQVKKIRDDYEKKLLEMRAEFKKLQSVEREHRRMQARQAAEQQQLTRLRTELADLKKTKVFANFCSFLSTLLVCLCFINIFCFFLYCGLSSVVDFALKTSRCITFFN